MNVRVLAGETVELINSRGKMVAVCRHSSSAYSGYVMGFEFTDDSEMNSGRDWSPLPATW
jgi:hypothetical protein